MAEEEPSSSLSAPPSWQEALKNVRYNEMAHLIIQEDPEGDAQRVTLTPCLDKENGGIVWQRIEESIRNHVRTKRWIWPMLNDRWRNQLYEQAIDSAVKELQTRKQESAKGDSSTSTIRVLDIGAGTGLLGMMACRSARNVKKTQKSCQFDVQVTAVEMSHTMAEIARQVIQDNRYQESIQVVEEHSCQFLQETDKFDLCVSELLDDGLLGEGILPSLRDAWDRHLAPDAIMIPSAARVFVQLVEGNELKQMYGPHVSDPCSFFLDKEKKTMLLEPSSSTIPIRANKWIKDGRIKVLSKPVPVFSFSFQRNQIPRDGHKTSVVCPVDKTGIIHGFLVSWELDLREGITYSMIPGTDKWQDHWHQTLQVLQQEQYRAIEAGGEVILSVEHDDYEVYVNLHENRAADSLQSKRQRFECIGQHISTFRCMQLNDSSYLSALSSQIRDAMDNCDHGKICTVLDVSDFPTCGLIAANLGAANIISMESSSGRIPEFSAMIAQLSNNLPRDSQSFQIIKCLPESLTRATLDNAAVDIITAEPYFEILEGWHIEEALNMFYTVRSLKARGLFQQGTKVVPSHCKIFGQFIRSEQLQMAYSQDEVVSGFDHSCIVQSDHSCLERFVMALDLTDVEFETVTESFILADLDFSKPSISTPVNKLWLRKPCDALMAYVVYGNAIRIQLNAVSLVKRREGGCTIKMECSDESSSGDPYTYAMLISDHGEQ